MEQVNMEQGKNKNGIIALLVVIIIILLALVILLATGIINLKSNVTNNSNNQSNVDITENNNTAKDNTNDNSDNQKSQDNDVSEFNYIRQTSVILVEEPNCTGRPASVKADINSSKNIDIFEGTNAGAEEIVVGNAKYLYKVGIIACDNVKLYYITEDNELYVVNQPSTGKPNQKGTKVTSSKIGECLGEDHRDDGSYLKVLTESKNIEYIKYFTAPDYETE